MVSCGNAPNNKIFMAVSPQSALALLGYFRSVAHIFGEGDRHLKEDAKELKEGAVPQYVALAKALPNTMTDLTA